MAASPFSETPESPDERMRRRRARRWGRRLRAVGPFFGVLLLLATLALSVDLIEYESRPEAGRLTSRPIPTIVLDPQPARRAASGDPIVSSASVVEASDAAGLAAPDLDLRLGADLADGADPSAAPRPSRKLPGGR